MSEHRRPKDIVELSPTSRAGCRSCGRKIMEGSWRIGEHFFMEKYEKWGVKYYHRSCAEENGAVLKRLKLTNDLGCSKSKRKLEDDLCSLNRQRIQMEVSNITKSEGKRRRLVYEERASLREKLRKLRTSFAEKLHVRPYWIFQDIALDGIVERMPSNSYELLQVKGIGYKKLKSFGSPILKIVASFKKSHCDEENGEGGDDIIVERELTIDEIVNQRFKEAEERGEVIEL